MVGFVTPRRTVAAVTQNTVATAGTHLPVDATSGGITVTLPAGKSEGAHLSVEKVDASSNIVTVTGNIRGATASIPLNYRYETLELIADSAGSWRVVSNHLPKAAVDAKIATQAATDSATYVQLRGAWVAGTAFPKNSLVIQGGAVYLAAADVPARATFAATDWQALGGAAVDLVISLIAGGFVTLTGSGVADAGTGIATLTSSLVSDTGTGIAVLAA